MTARAPAIEAQAQFTAVYRAEFGYVWKVLGRLGVQASQKEDLAHDVFAAVFRHWSQYDSQRPIRPWLFGISYRVVLDFHRKHQNQREDLVESIEVQDEADSAEDSLAAAQARRVAQQALEMLDLERRAIFILHEIDECPIPAVAESLGIGLNTAYSRLRLARRDFNAAVDALQKREALP